jgi:putative SOS response-associated peptidase YedK
MCTNYRAGSRDFIRAQFGLEADFDYAAETYPGYAAPIVRGTQSGIDCVAAGFGLIPHWARDTKIARSTYNARSETVAEKPSFRHAWRQRQFCLVPMQSFYEPNYESGRAVRWRIERADGHEFTVAGIWERWCSPTAAQLISFSMLTINADAHALMRRFHAPGDEKRSLVIVGAEDADRWLHADEATARQMLHAFDATRFAAYPDPRPLRGKPRTHA